MIRFKGSTRALAILVLTLCTVAAFGQSGIGDQPQTILQAQTTSRAIELPTFQAFPKAALPPQGSMADEGRSTSQRWEIGFHFGGSFGRNWSGSNADCTPVFDCDLTNDFSFGQGDGLLPVALANSVPELMTREGVTPGNGPLGGARIGYDLTDRWQMEFVWNYVGTNMHFTNDLGPVDKSIAIFCDPDSFETCGDSRNFQFLDRGKGGAKQHQFLVNMNYHMRSSGKFIPYVGFGFGGVLWQDTPQIRMMFQRPGGPGCCPPGSIGLFNKMADDSMALALDAAFGFKWHFTEGFGVRGEVMNLISLPRFDHTFETIDVDGQISTAGSTVPQTGTLQQRGVMNQVQVTGGVFFRF